MPVFNRPVFLSASVESIFNGNVRAGDELIIVDDGSTDETPAVIEQLAKRYSGIGVIRHRFNKGSAAAGRNTGIDAAAHEWIFCLDSDNLLLPGSVPSLLEYAVENSADAASFGGRDYFNQHPQQVLYAETYKPGLLTFADGLTGLVWPGLSGNYLFTRGSWVRAGRQNEFVGGGIDSWAFGIRQLATGTRFFCQPGSVYKHRVGHESAYTVDEKDGKTSLKALAAILPFLDQLEEESVDYLLAKETRKSWFENLPRRPLKIKDAQTGIGGTMQVFTKPPSLAFRIRYKLARMIEPAAGSRTG
jgi:glycosyltransferase involved in cell wall biosynthesis